MIKAWLELGGSAGVVIMEGRLQQIKLRKDLGNGRSRWVMLDKTAGKWLNHIPHRTLETPENYLRRVGVMNQPSKYDEVLDAIVATIPFDGYGPDDDCTWIEGQVWQSYVDVDTLEEFEFGEAMMEHYILKGRGPDIYYQYAEDYTQFIGNARQL